MESNQNFGELSWPTDFGLDGLKSGHTKNITEDSVMSLSCSGSQDVSVATPCLLLILTCSAGACYPRKRHGLNLLWNQICRLPCLAAFTVSVCIPLRASSHGLQPYTDGLRPCRQQKTPQRNLQCRFLVAGRRIELRTS